MSSKKERRRLYEGFGVLEDIEKPKTIIEQSSNNSNTQPKTVLETNLKQLSNISKTEDTQSSNNSNTQPKTVLETNLKQLSNISKTTSGFYSIVGLQRKILDYLFLKAQGTGSLSTDKIFTEVIAEMLKCSIETVRTSTQRLEKKGLIIRKEYKSGRGGFSIFEIEKTAYQKMVFENNSKTIIEQSSNNSNTQPNTQPKTNLANSSNDLKYSNITTSIQIPENLKTSISLKEIQKLLEKQLLNEEDLMKSLEHFSYDLENNLVRAKTSPINLFFGLVRSGQRYKSLKLLDLENRELQEYQNQLQKLEEENKRLKELELKEKYHSFKEKNPEFLKQIKAENQFLKTDEMADKIGFSKFLEEQQQSNYERTAE